MNQDELHPPAERTKKGWRSAGSDKGCRTAPTGCMANLQKIFTFRLCTFGKLANALSQKTSRMSGTENSFQPEINPGEEEANRYPASRPAGFRGRAARASSPEGIL